MIWLTLFFVPFHLACLIGLTYVGVALIHLALRVVRRITRWLGPSTIQTIRDTTVEERQQ